MEQKYFRSFFLQQFYKILPGLSDHEAVLIQTKTIPTVQKQQQRKIYLYDKAQ